MDLWGKYDVTSINRHQYYLLLVDDATRYVTVYFLKGKHEAAQHVKNYLIHLQVRGIRRYARKCGPERPAEQCGPDDSARSKVSGLEHRAGLRISSVHWYKGMANPKISEAQSSNQNQSTLGQLGHPNLDTKETP